MIRADKVAAVERLNKTFAGSPHVIVTTFRGLTVNQANDLRRRIGGVGGSYTVIKNRLAKRSAAGTSAERLGASFNGPCAIAAHDSDPIALAKALSEFIKDNPQLEMLAGVIDAQDLVDGEGVKRLATLPGLPELRAQLLALMQTPGTMLVRLLNTPGGQIARAIDAHREKLAGGEG